MRTFQKSIAILMAITFLLILASCSGSEGEPTAKRQFLSVGTAPQGGTFNVVGGAIAQVVNDVKSASNWQVSSEATKGTQENIRRLENSELDFALGNAAITYFATRGEGAWEKKYSTRSVMTLAPNIAMFVTTRSSGITSLADLKGKRVVVGPAGAGFEYFIQPLLAAHGVTYDDFTQLNNTQTGAVDMLADGSADAAFLGGGVPTPSIMQASATQDILLIPLDEKARQQLVKEYPFFGLASIKANTYRGQEETYEGLNVGAMQLISSASVSEELVYEFTKALYQNRAEVVKAHPAGKAINQKNIVRNTGIPFHPGAIKFYKEAGFWTE
ncbi:MAG: TAXI family TRAP transporter solute-binding subunit [Calditrichia bacterium]